MDSFHQALDIFYFTYTPKQIEWYTSPKPVKEQSILCQWTEIQPNQYIETLNEKDAAFASKEGLPMSVYGSTRNKQGHTLYCGNFVRENKGWKATHVNTIKIQ